MEKIRPTVGYLGAWNAVNQANKPKTGYSSLTAMKQERFSPDKLEAVYYVRRRGALAQLVHSFLWTVSPGYRNKKLENRQALLNMIEDQIRTSSGQPTEYAYNGKKSYRGIEVSEDHKPSPEDRPSQAHREVWQDGQPPGDFPEEVKKALKRAERNIGDRQAFLDSLHRVFLTASAHLDLNPDEATTLSVEESHASEQPLFDSLSESTQQPQDLQVELRKKANGEETQAALTLAIKNENWKNRQTRGGRIEPDGFKTVTARHTQDSATEPGDVFRGSVMPENYQGYAIQQEGVQRRPLPDIPVGSHRESVIEIGGTGHTSEMFRQERVERQGTGTPDPNAVYSEVQHQHPGQEGTAEVASTVPPPKPARHISVPEVPKGPVAAPRTKDTGKSTSPAQDMENADKDVIQPAEPPKTKGSETLL